LVRFRLLSKRREDVAPTQARGGCTDADQPTLELLRPQLQQSSARIRARVAADPSQPNLRQVHLIHSELFCELSAKGFTVSYGQLGENVTTRDVDLLGLPQGARLHLGKSAIIQVTGLRNPCYQLDRFQTGLLEILVMRDDQGRLIRKAGIMGIVLAGGEVRPGDLVDVELPLPPYKPLDCV